MINDEAFLPGLCRTFYDVKQHRTTNHGCSQFSGIGLCGFISCNQSAATHDRDVISHMHDFFKLMRDEKNGFAFITQDTQKSEEMIRFIRRQHGCRLVKNENFCAAKEYFCNLNSLATANPKIGN